MKTRTKLAAIFFLFSVSSIVLLSASVYFFIIRYSFADFYKRLEIRGVVMAKSVLDHEEASASVLQEVRRLHLEKLPGEEEHFFLITPGKTFEKEAVELKLPLRFFDQVIQDGEASYQSNNTFFSGILYKGEQGDYVVIVSADNYYNTHHLAYLRNIFLVGIVAASIFSLFISFAFSRMVFAPVVEITNKVKEISSENLHLRLEPSGVDDEINHLKSTFNNMLDRLETSFETQNNFISNASHELGTPLTTIIGEADVTLTKPRTTEEYVRSLEIILNKAERLEGITKSLLFLAHTGFNGKVQRFDRVRADQLLWDVKQTIDKINPDNQVKLNLSLMPENPEDLKIYGNEQLLHIALSNIVTNACKYSNNAPVLVSIGTSQQHVFIVVKDTGIGIPEGELKYIYDPFFRASNTGEFAGYGIGLPLSRNIVRMHGGEISVTSREGEGTVVQLTFKVARRAMQAK